MLQIEDANFFVNASLNAIGNECKSPSSVNSGSAASAMVGGPHHVGKDTVETFVFPSASSSHEVRVQFVFRIHFIISFDGNQRSIPDEYK